MGNFKNEDVGEYGSRAYVHMYIFAIQANSFVMVAKIDLKVFICALMYSYSTDDCFIIEAKIALKVKV